MTIYIWLCIISSAVTFYVHTFIGGPIVAGPLLKDSSLPAASKWLNYYCWHITTILLLFFTGAFVWLAFYPHKPSLVFLSSLSALLSILSITIARKAGISPLRFPSTSLFAVIAFFGTTAIITS